MTARIIRWRKGKHSRHTAEYPGTGSFPFLRGEAGTGLSTVTPSRYAIELRDKDFVLKGRLEHVATSVSWDWNRFGGCGKCTIKIDGDYSLVEITADDDIRIYLPNASSGSTLWYRGYVTTVTPNIQAGNKGGITIECSGYFGWLDRIIVQDSGAPKSYTSQELSLIVSSIIDDFIVANSSVTRGTVDAGNFTPDVLTFKSTAKEAIRTIFDLSGDVECGVDANLQFFWRTQSTALRYVFYVGGDVTKLNDRRDFDRIINQIYFEGGESGGATYVTDGQSQSSIRRYGRHEKIITNSAITTASVAARYMSGVFRQSASPFRDLSISVKNSKRRLEASLPIGACSVVDQDFNATGAIYGTVGNGGSGKIYGRLADGGSGQVYGGVAKHQVDRIQYTLSPEDGRIHSEITFGNSVGYSKASATLKQIEQQQSALRQRTL